MGAVVWGLWPTLRIPSPLIKPNVPISGIRLSDWLSSRDTRGVNQPRAESARWLTLLRPSIQQSRTAPVFDGVLRLIANHHDLSIFESAPEVRVLSSTGITRLQQSYDPVRLPSVPPPVATLRPLPSPVTGLPRLPEPPFQRAVPTTPADRAGACVDCFPAHAAFPKWQEGRHPHCHFRGLLRLYSRYGPPDRSAAQGDLCHEAPALPVAQPSRSSATRTIDNSLGGIFLH